MLYENFDMDNNSNDKKILMISVPTVSLMLPSQQFASILAYMRANGIEVKTEFPSYEYIHLLGEENYEKLKTDDIGNELFGSLLCDELGKLQNDEFLSTIYPTTEKFVKSFAQKIQNYRVDCIVFYVQYSQLIPALYFAKIINAKSKTKIIFIGFHCGDVLGENLKMVFPFVDETFGKNFEETLLAYLKDTKIEEKDNLDFLPTPDYSDAYNKILELKNKGLKVNEDSIGFLVEFSRGCGWNKCSFCTLNCHTDSFRTRSKINIKNDYRYIREKYKTNVIIPEHFEMAENWREQIAGLSDFTKATSKNLVLNFKVKDLQNEKDFELLKNADAAILVGTESFSNDYLLKLNKGQSVIENIQVLKYAERWGVPCFHNVMFGLPFENERHLKESKKNFEYIYHLQPPFDVEKFRLTFGSAIFNHQEKYGIKRVFKQNRLSKCLSSEIQEKYIPFFYDFESENGIEDSDNKWLEAVKTWRAKYYFFHNISEPQREKMLVKSYYENVYQIVDYRKGYEVYSLNNTEKKIYDFIDKICYKHEIYENFSEMSPSFIDEIIQTFVNKKIAFIEDERVLGLAL